MNIKAVYCSLLLFILISFGSCIDPYEIDLNQNNQVLVVEGFLTDDGQNPDTIRIQYSVYRDAYIALTPIASVKASVFNLTSGEEIKLIEYGTGKFLPPLNFKPKLNNKYVLKFNLPNGQTYESSPESLQITPSIAKVYDTFNPKSRLAENGKGFVSANEIFVDFQDIPNQKNYYLWRYTQYERLQHCMTCNYSMYDFYKDACVNRLNYLRESYYDYGCAEECYAIIKGKEVNVMSDVVSDGALVTARLVAKVPYYYDSGCLLDIEQMCISPEMYAYHKILESQSQTSGGLADTPPAAIVGNIQNVNAPNEKVVGHFGVVNIQKKRYWVNRANVTGPIEYILGHRVVEEPQNPPTRPPLARCKRSPTRTPFKPQGWQ